VLLTGSGDRITAPPISVPARDFTVAAWFRWATNPSPYYSGIQGSGLSWELRIRNDGRFAVVFYQSIGPDVVTEVASVLAYNDGDWHHAAAVLQSGLVRLYVDGVLVAQDTTNPIASVRTSTQTVVGRVASDFVGDIDEVFVFSRVLSDAEIAALASSSSDTSLQYSETLSRNLQTQSQWTTTEAAKGALGSPPNGSLVPAHDCHGGDPETGEDQPLTRGTIEAFVIAHGVESAANTDRAFAAIALKGLVVAAGPERQVPEGPLQIRTIQLIPKTRER